jgi:molecular chaperone HscB
MYKDPFTVLGIEPSFELDFSSVDANYFALQCGWHPDRFVGKSSLEQEFAQSQTVLLNQSYSALKDPIERAKALIFHMGGKEPFPETKNVLLQAFEWQDRLESSDPTLLEELKQQRVNLEHMLQKAFAEKNLESIQELYGLLVYCLKTLRMADGDSWGA